MEATVPQHCNCTVRFGCSGTCYTEYSVYGEYHGIQYSCTLYTYSTVVVPVVPRGVQSTLYSMSML